MKTQIFSLLFILGLLTSNFLLAGERSNFQQTESLSETINVYPNPIHQKGTIKINLDATSLVRVEFYDLSGQKVKEIKDLNLQAGESKIEFQVNDMKEGFYLCKVISDQWVKSKRILVRK
ncbi:MAG: T9SS type A sorting domain-containing protein [Prolixibacteraceae bacterium]